MNQQNKQSIFKIQSAMEYLITYGWAILIIVIVMAILFIFAKLPTQFNNNICTFLNGVNCNDVILFSNTSNSVTQLIVSLSNKQLFSLENPKFNVSVGNKNYTGACFSSLNAQIYSNIIYPGNIFYCIANISYVFPGIGIKGDLYLNVTNCGFSADYNLSNQTCTKSEVFNIYLGNIYIHSIAVSKSKFKS